MIKAVIFDMDGVLVDSLQAHLDYCLEQATNLGLVENINIPSKEDFITNIARDPKKTISPMEEFFKAVGFPKNKAGEADKAYQKQFYNKQCDEIKLFPGASEMLHLLNYHGVKLGLVTSNRKEIVKKVLGDCFNLFKTDFLLTADSGNKSDNIITVVSKMKAKPSQVIYVGDQRKDAEAAKTASVKFLGVTWGWEITAEDQNKYENSLVNNRSELTRVLLNLTATPTIEELKIILKHGEAFFVYHATQRHASIRFYLITLSIMISGYMAIFAKESLPFEAGVFLGLFGVVISLFFWTLDTRNEQLVHCSEAPLMDAQKELAQRFGISSFKIIEESGGRSFRFISYVFLMPYLFYFFILLNLIGICISFNALRLKGEPGGWGAWLTQQGHCFGTNASEILISFLILMIVGGLGIFLSK